MIRKLLIVFVAAGLVALVSGALFAGIYRDRHWDWSELDDPLRWRDVPDQDAGAVETREFQWPGSDSLDIDLPFAKVIYTQSPDTKLTITGSKSVLDEVVVENGQIGLRDGVRLRGRDGSSNSFFSGNMNITVNGRRVERRSFSNVAEMTITLSAPDVRRFEAGGGSELEIKAYDQPRLTIDLGGMGKVTAAGRTDNLDLDISGSGDADLTGLIAKQAEVDVSGMGDAKLVATDAVDIDISGSGSVDLSSQPVKVAVLEISGMGDIKLDPVESADIEVSGSGDVELLRRPQNLNSRVSGMGKVNQP